MSSRAKIAVLDYGMGNRVSVKKALEHIGAEADITSKEADLRNANGLVIVGVGAFPEAVRQLDPFRSLLQKRYEAGTPILGICLGLQLFFDDSNEHEGARGFGFLKGTVEQVEARGRKLPHIGWNRVRWEQPSQLLHGLPDECPFYHVHSYAARPATSDVVLGTTRYGEEFVSAVQHESLFGVQFHPEKSSEQGLQLLKNFAKVCAGPVAHVRPSVVAPRTPGDLCKRIVPCLDVADGRVVKGTNFVNLRDAGDPIELAEFYYREGADEIAFLDITATHEKRDMIVELAKRAVSEVFVPITIGGGIRSVDDAQAVLDAGADNISINSAAVARPELLDELTHVFANQNLILAIDAKRHADGKSWDVYVAGGRTLARPDAIGWARRGVELGAGEILITSMDCDGTQDGYDMDLIRTIVDAVDVPVIASGGAGTLGHMDEALAAGADAVLCASILHYGHYGVQEIKNHLRDRRIPVRPQVEVQDPDWDGIALTPSLAAVGI